MTLSMITEQVSSSASSVTDLHYHTDRVWELPRSDDRLIYLPEDNWNARGSFIRVANFACVVQILLHSLNFRRSLNYFF